MTPLWGLCLLVFVGLGFCTSVSAQELSGHAGGSCPGLWEALSHGLQGCSRTSDCPGELCVPTGEMDLHEHLNKSITEQQWSYCHLSWLSGPKLTVMCIFKLSWVFFWLWCFVGGLTGWVFLWVFLCLFGWVFWVFLGGFCVAFYVWLVFLLGFCGFFGVVCLFWYLVGLDFFVVCLFFWIFVWIFWGGFFLEEEHFVINQKTAFWLTDEIQIRETGAPWSISRSSCWALACSEALLQTEFLFCQKLCRGLSFGRQPFKADVMCCVGLKYEEISGWEMVEIQYAGGKRDWSSP